MTTVSTGVGGGATVTYVVVCDAGTVPEDVPTKLGVLIMKSMTLSFTPELCKSMMSDVLR